MRLKAVAVVLVSCAICWGGTAVSQETDSEVSRAIWLLDDFEDQNLDGWRVPTGPCTATIDSVGAAGTSYSLLVDGACGHDGGTSYDLGEFQATAVSLFVKTTGTATARLYVILDDDDQATNGYIVAFLASNSGWLSVFAGPATEYELMPINSLDWHDLQFNIDWIGKNVDVFINGIPRQYNLPFATDSISTIRQIHLYNLSAGLGWYDQILLTTPPASTFVMSDDFESSDTSGWTTSVPELPQRLVIFSVAGVSGAIGGRSGADVLCGQGAQGMPGLPLNATTRAFLSVDSIDSIANMPARYGVPTDRKVTGPNLTVIADNWADLMDGTIDTTLLDAGAMTANTWYSGSYSDGSVATSTCNGWTQASGGSGRYGFHSTTTSAWISSGEGLCGNGLARVVCLAWR